MSSPSLLLVQRNIDRVISSLLPFYDFINMQMVPWIVEKHWKTYVDEEIRKEITSKEDVKSAVELFYKQNSPPPELIKKLPALHRHIQHQRSFFLENLDDKLYLTEDELMEEFKRLNMPISTGLSFNVREFMKEKKNHEVEITSQLVATLARARGKEHFVLDVGDGKGYLSSRLAIEFNLKVLGVDGNLMNSVEALKRNEKLSTAWKHLVKKGAKRSEVEAVPELTAPDPNLYRTTSAMIFDDTDLVKLIEDAYPDEVVGDICLAGLHTCGNLGANTLRQFVNNDKIKVVMSVPCCFNLIHEEFVRDYFNDIERPNELAGNFGFPMSDYLRKKNFKLGRNARMLGTQCLERVLEGKSSPDGKIFYRAIFEKLLRERFLKGQPVKKFKLGRFKRCDSLEDYIVRGCKKLKINMDLTSEEIADLEKEFEFERELINLHYLLRLLLAKSIEALFSLDRLLYLLEKDIRHVYLVKLFDPTISPRNLAVIAIKD